MPISRESPVRILIDDRILVAHLVGEPIALPSPVLAYTTTYWYYRACRAALAGGAGRLSGPFRRLTPEKQAAAIAVMLGLPDDIGLPDPRPLVPEMVAVHRRHPHLNVLNVEATAGARLISARVLLSPPAARGLLAPVLDEEGIEWEVVGG